MRGDPTDLAAPAPPAGPPVPAPAAPREPEEPADEVDAYRMTLLDHLLELRSRLIKAGVALLVGLGICLPFGSEIFDWLIAPTDGRFPEGSGFIYTQVAEKFITDLKVSLFAAVFLASPVLFAQAWGFVAPGLYKRERMMIIPFVLASTVFFSAGAGFCYYGILPLAMDFFLKFAVDGIDAQITVSAYLSFMTRFLMGFGLVFELPLAIFFLARLGIVTAKGLAEFRKYAVVLAFLAGAMLTPPDPMSQAALAVPIILLYEVGILTARIWGKERPAPAEADAEA